MPVFSVKSQKDSQRCKVKILVISVSLWNSPQWEGLQYSIALSFIFVCFYQRGNQTKAYTICSNINTPKETHPHKCAYLYRRPKRRKRQRVRFHITDLWFVNKGYEFNMSQRIALLFLRSDSEYFGCSEGLSSVSSCSNMNPADSYEQLAKS